MKNLLRPKEYILVMYQFLAIGTLFAALFLHKSLGLWLLGLLGYVCIFGLGITVTFHRLLAHRSYNLWKPLEYLFALFANLGCTGSSVGWVFVHRMHHAYSETALDPHSPKAHGRVGAIIGKYGTGFNKWLVRDVINDGVHRFYHDYYLLLLALYAGGAALIGADAFIFGFAMPVALNTMVSRLSNWIDHEPRFGIKQNAVKDDSRNVWWWSIVALGEGWHNNHHAHPGDYEFGKGRQFDFGKSVIHLLMHLKLASKK